LEHLAITKPRQRLNCFEQEKLIH